MIVVPAGVKVQLALGHTDMRKGLDGLSTLIQEHLRKIRSRVICSSSAARMPRS
ncbi:transposase [Mesorhizobium sp. WSM4313]|uniref:transposase n=1 Tax=Mesorhizobium sp. WSM4313 TaxID=2029412 RepID=UPI001FD92F5A|nr:transposase [Mesorhizobium sp. WSM4313]